MIKANKQFIIGCFIDSGCILLAYILFGFIGALIISIFLLGVAKIMLYKNIVLLNEMCQYMQTVKPWLDSKIQEGKIVAAKLKLINTRIDAKSNTKYH